VALACEEETVSASEAIARLRELRAKATAGDWLAIKSPRHNHWKIGDGRSVYFDVCNFINIEHFAKWGTSGTAEDNAKYTAAAMNSLPALLDAASQLEKLTEAASCIRHWHDAMADGSGMVVSAEHVRKLWDATEQARAALQALAEGGGE
jgi:hypothetical protein